MLRVDIRCLVRWGVFWFSTVPNLYPRVGTLRISLNLKGVRLLTNDKLIELGYTLFIFDLLGFEQPALSL